MTRWIAPGIALLAAIALALFAVADSTAAARGWLCAFIFIAMVPIGSLGLLLVWGISGGRWGADFEPVLAPAARAIPLLILAFIPVIVLRPLLYQWSTLHLPRDVLHLYLNPVFFDARTLIALAIWSALAWTRAWRNPLFAGLGLVVHLILETFIPADWILTITPGSTSAGFGLGFGIEQMFAALAFTALLAPQAPGRANRDLVGIMVTTLLGTVYFLFMQFLIIWYGNIPEKVHWFAFRAAGWWWVALLAFAFGAAGPFLAALNPYVRREPSAMRAVGVLMICGVALHIAYMVMPAFGPVAAVPAILCAVLISLLMLMTARNTPIAGGAHER